jgi:CHAT domain-containing protein/tetratricopeptide (TPR) repeat protein
VKRRGSLDLGGFRHSGLITVLACALSAAAVAQAIPDAQAGTSTTLRSLLDAGDYATAQRVAEDEVARAETEHGPASIQTAQALDGLVEALVSNGLTAADKTLDQAERALRLKERHFGVSHFEVAVSLRNLGALRTERGEFKQAALLHARALSIRRKAFTTDATEIVESLEDLAVPLIYQERFRDAQSALEEALRVRDAGATLSPMLLAHTLSLAALLHRYDGSYAVGTEFAERALDIRRRLSPEHPATGITLQIRGDLQFLTGDIAAARRTWSDALSLDVRVLRPGHPAIIAIQRRLAAAANAFGERAEQHQLLEQALQNAERSLAPCSLEFPRLLGDSASAAMYDSEYVEAQKLYVRARSVHERCDGPKNTDTGTVIFNQANLAVRMGDIATAEKLYQQAISIWTNALGASHPYVAMGLDAHADVLALRGLGNRSATLYERALQIRQQALGPDHPDVAWTLVNLARVRLLASSFEEALRLVGQAVDIYRRTGASDDPDHFARALSLMAQIHTGRAEYDQAESSLNEALSTRERIFGASDPLVAETRAEIAALDFRLGSNQRSLVNALNAERIGREHLRTTVRYLPERQALTYAARRPKGLDLALSIAASDSSPDAAQVFESAIRSRSVVLDELAARAQAAQTSDPGLTASTATLFAARQRFANLMMRNYTEPGSVPLTMLEDARKQKEDAEAALAERSTAFRNERARSEIGLAEVRAALPRDSALVAFIRYDRTIINPPGGPGAAASSGPTSKPPVATPSYIAFVIRTGSDMFVAPLGSAAVIDGLVSNWRAQMTGIIGAAAPTAAEQSYRAAGAALRRRVWDPLREPLSGAKTVFIVPDGTLSLVSFVALPVGQAQYLIEDGPVIHYLSAERDLVAGPASTSTGRGLLAVGGAAFDDAGSFVPPSKRSTAGLRSACATSEPLTFGPLDGTRQEVQDVARLWTDSPADLLQGGAASERAFKQSAPGHRVLHLATHGFFLGSCASTRAAGTRSVGGLVAARATQSAGLDESPLLQSGLALAGANRRAAAGPGDEDGILTAEEVTALHLDGVEWAVLSACDTGLGAVRASEGVLGLRRAFQVAGVRTIIMSLWPVDDQATRLWMLALYQGRLQQHFSTSDAVQYADLSMLRARRTQRQSTHPFYWAAFVAAGDWR